MLEHNPPPLRDNAHAPVIPLPTALYVSDGLVFELYDGGQPCRSFSIRWDRLVPGQQNESEPTSRTGLHTRQD
jgi:hypothetical protein